MKRRDLMWAAPAALLAGAVPAVAEPETPVMKAYREYVAYREWLNGPATDGFPCDLFDRKVENLNRLVERIADTPSQCPSDTAIKFFAVATDFEALHGNPYRGILEAEARALIGGAA